MRIVEVSLERLRAGASLTVDELCHLIRSLEMSQAPDSNGPCGSASDAIGLDEASLDRYAGFYQLGDWSVITLTRQGPKLLIGLHRAFPGGAHSHERVRCRACSVSLGP